MRSVLRIIFTFLLLSLVMHVDAQHNLQQASRETQRKNWNKTLIYGKVFVREHTAFLNEALEGRTPGKALDVAMGEGRNTLYLARKGWETTGFDIADVALDSAQARAKREGLKITTVEASREEFNFGKEKWDLIVVLYADVICGGCCAYDTQFIETVKKALKPGGRFVYEWYTREGILTVEPKARKNEKRGCKSNSIKESFEMVGGFNIVHYTESLGIPEWDPSKKFQPTRMIYFIADKKCD